MIYNPTSASTEPIKRQFALTRKCCSGLGNYRDRRLASDRK